MKTLRNIFSLFGILILILLTACGDDNSSDDGDDNPPAPETDWTKQFSGVAAGLNDVFFVHPDNGWIVGDNEVILNTGNGGIGWTVAPPTPPLEDLRSVMFVNRLIGWMAGDLFANPTEGQVVISTYGGTYPENQVSVDDPMNVVFFVDESTGWAAGENGVILSTSDAGIKWTTRDFPNERDIIDVFFLSANGGWACTSQGGIYETLDGETWTSYNDESTADILALHFIDETHGWACGKSNTILKATQGTAGIEWTSVNISEEDALQTWRDIFFVDEQTGWVVGDRGKVYKSTDGGDTWTRETTGLNDQMNAIHMISSTSGWIVGDIGLIMKYTP